MNNVKKVTVGSGNVFADLGFANPEEELLKAKLIREIRSIIKVESLLKPKLPSYLDSSNRTFLLLSPAVSVNSQSTVWFVVWVGWITK